jgi:hypothetical protein
MVKQIKEQVEILAQHLTHAEIDLLFVSEHALRLSQIADDLRAFGVASETTTRHEEFMRKLDGLIGKKPDDHSVH